MPADNEIQTLVGIAASAIVRAATTSATGKSVGPDYPEAMIAGAKAAESLVVLLLSDIKRIADSMEILAKAELERSKNGATLWPKS